MPPLWTGAPQFGHARSKISPQTAQNFPPTGSACSKSGRNKERPSTTYGIFEGQIGFGQNACTFAARDTCVGTATHGAALSPAFGNSMPNFLQSFAITSSFSLVPSPCSNIERADCKQPTSFARMLCESPASRRAILIWRQISGLRSITAIYYGLFSAILQAEVINSYLQSYQLTNTLLIILLITILNLSTFVDSLLISLDNCLNRSVSESRTEANIHRLSCTRCHIYQVPPSRDLS